MCSHIGCNHDVLSHLSNAAFSSPISRGDVHCLYLRKVFDKLRKSNFKIQLDKSEFLHKEAAFLGHVVIPCSVKPNPDKVKAIKNLSVPRTQKKIKRFLGLLGYYREFIQDFVKLTKPRMTKKGRSVQLAETYVKSFELCKDLLMNDPIVQYLEFIKPFILTADASNLAIVVVLSQGTIGTGKLICFVSRTLTDTEINYSTVEN